VGAVGSSIVIGYITLGTSDLKRAATFYDALLAEVGAKDEGAPGPRGQGFYAGYFRDLDGNKLNVFFMG
jgi:catechol 2,3-dioxygenase-like lactoylglutathione lyase family enzyme